MKTKFGTKSGGSTATELRADVRDSDGALLVMLDVLEDDDSAEVSTRVPPTEFRLFANGITPTTKGPIICSSEAALAVMQKMAASGRDKLPFDYGHAMLGFVQGYDSARAAGWFKLAERAGELWATEIEWTPKALQAFADKEFRYFSPAIMLDTESRVITECINCALTNIPATLNQAPLVTDNRGSSMDPTLQKLCAAMGVQNADQATAKYDGLRNENDKLVKAASELQTQLSAANAALEVVKADKVKAEKATVIEKLSKDGKLSPAMRDWAETQTVEQLNAFGNVASPIVPASSVAARPSEGSPTTLSDDQKTICVQLGISEKDYLKALKAQAVQVHPFAFNPEIEVQ